MLHWKTYWAVWVPSFQNKNVRKGPISYISNHIYFIYCPFFIRIHSVFLKISLHVLTKEKWNAATVKLPVLAPFWPASSNLSQITIWRILFLKRSKPTINIWNGLSFLLDWKVSLQNSIKTIFFKYHIFRISMEKQVEICKDLLWHTNIWQNYKGQSSKVCGYAISYWWHHGPSHWIFHHQCSRNNLLFYKDNYKSLL